MRLWIVVLVGFVLVIVLTFAGWALRAAQTEPVQEVSAKWATSGHADANAEAFVHWNEDDPPVIPPECAKCHSTFGYLDFLGQDSSGAQRVDHEARIGTVIYCNVCHNDAAHAMMRVAFPSGAEITGLGAEANCMQCHQGTESGNSVRQAVAGLTEDNVSADLEFINVHYAIAAATQMGGEVQAACQYEGQTYVGRFEHTRRFQTCTQCHDPHSLRVEPRACSPCHAVVTNQESLRAIRANNDPTDYDGDGNIAEGVAGEIETLQAALYRALQDYAAQVSGTPLVYSHEAFPYFFADTNANGQPDPDETNFGNRYAAWTPRLVRLAYNYHFTQTDPANYTHNPRYVLQILYDSLRDAGQQVNVPLAGKVRP